MSKLAYGIGVNGGEYPTKIGGKNTKEYDLWHHMLLRCTEKWWDKYPTYIGTTCSENFKNFAFFYEWCQEQVGFGNKDEKGKSWHLDKDLLTNGAKHYSEGVCVFVPQRINKLLIKSDASRGEWPVGVSWRKNTNKFEAHCNTGSGKQQHLGFFTTPQEAFLSYKTFKEVLIKQVASEYKHLIDGRVYEALMDYRLNEND